MGSTNLIFIIAILFLSQLWLIIEAVDKVDKQAEHKDAKPHKPNANDHEVQGVLGWTADKVKSVFKPIHETGKAVEELRKAPKELNLHQRMCKFLVERLSDDQSMYASGLGGAYGTVGQMVLKNDGADKCVEQIAKKNKEGSNETIKFSWHYEEDQELDLFEVFQFGGQLLTQLDIYGRHFKYSAEFYDNLVERILGNPEAYPDMIADVNIRTYGAFHVEWPRKVKDILSVEEVMKIEYGEQYPVTFGQGVRVLVENHSKKSTFGWWGIVYIVEKDGNNLFKFALVNNDGQKYNRNISCELGKFVEFRLMKV